MERDKLSEAQNKRFQDPAERMKNSEAQKKRFADPAERTKNSEGQKKRFLREGSYGMRGPNGSWTKTTR